MGVIGTRPSSIAESPKETTSLPTDQHNDNQVSSFLCRMIGSPPSLSASRTSTGKCSCASAPTITVLPASPRSPIEKSQEEIDSGSSSFHVTADLSESGTANEAGGGQVRGPRPRRLSWSSDILSVTDLELPSSETPMAVHISSFDVLPPRRSSSIERPNYGATQGSSRARTTARNLTLPLPHIQRSYSGESVDGKTGRSTGLPVSVNAEHLVGVGNRRTRRRSQTGPPLLSSIQSQLALIKGTPKRSPPTTPTAGEPAVMVSVEHRDQQSLAQSSTSDVKLHQKWVTVLREMFKDLAEQSDRKARTIDKETFLKYFPLPGVLGERLFDLFDADDSQTIDFHEFFMGLAVIYNGTAAERKRFLFNMYDLDGNGYITREELAALLTHIPAAFEVLHQIGEMGMIEAGSNLDFEAERTRGRGGSSHHGEDDVFRYGSSGIKSVEDKVATIVRTVFSDRNHPSTGHLSHSPLGTSRDDDGLNFEQFCEALEKNAEISELLNLFYDFGMPDLPVPHDTLRPSMLLHDKISGFFCGRTESGERYKFLGISLPSIVGHSTSSSSSSSGQIPSSSRQSLPSDTDVYLPPPQTSPLGVTPRSYMEETHIYPSPESLSQPRDTTPDPQNGDCWSGNYARTESGQSSRSVSDETLDPPVPPYSQVPSRKSPCCEMITDHTSSFEKVPIVSGWLYKVGRRFNMKHYRFFVLRDRFLYYYAHVKDQAPKKALFMQDAQIGSVCHTEARNAYPFDIYLPSGRMYRLFASTRRDRDIWVRALTRASRTSIFHDDYQLQSPRARGKFAVVHRGVNKMTQEPVAVKILVKKDVGKEDRQFLRTEVAVMRLIHHANVVRLIDVYNSSQYLYVVMEWVSRGDVGALTQQIEMHADHHCCCSYWSSYRQFLTRSRSKFPSVMGDGKADGNQHDLCRNHGVVLVTRTLVSERLALIVARGVLLGLVYLHKHNIIHRDLKPENILMVSAHDVASTSPSFYLDAFDNHNHSPSENLNHECSLSHGFLDHPSAPREKSTSEHIAAGIGGSLSGTEWKSNNTMETTNHIETAQHLNCPCSQCSLCQILYSLLDVKISDFGLSKILAPSGVAFEQLGTLIYAAPEVVLGQPYDHAVDLWSLGVVIYRLLSGKFPFAGDDDSVTAECIIHGKFEFRPPELWKKFPDLSKDFVTKLLQVDPMKRPTAAECLEHPWIEERFSPVTGH